MKKILIAGPVLSRSGYGEMARLAIRSLRRFENEIDLYVLPYSWGNTSWLSTHDEERKYIDNLIQKHALYSNATQGNVEYDISIQITIPNEWKKLAKYNVGYTAGIETNFMSPHWFEPIQMMDKVLVISNHAKSSIVNSVFANQQGQNFKVSTPVEVVHFPVRDFTPEELDLELKDDFNFLSVCQWGPRKNLEQTIANFIEEFHDENVGLVLKTNNSNDSNMDKELAEKRLSAIIAAYPNKKCRVYLLHGLLSEPQMTSLYKNPKIKAIVSTTFGEGYGLPLFEAAYNDLPVVATDWSGHLDFLTSVEEDGSEKKLFAKVEYDLKPIPDHAVWNGVLEKGSSWAYPRPNSFKSKLREVYKDYGRFKSWSKKLNKWIRQEFTEKRVYDRFSNFVFDGQITLSHEKVEIPKVSIVTSVFNGDDHIEGFMKNIVEQTCFEEKCELVLVNCNSPGNEESVIKPYLEKYPNNIKYIKLDNDPGIYSAWNIAIKNSTGEFITNANLDDRKSPKFIEELASHLVKNNDVDVVYADNLLTMNANETWETNTAVSTYPSEQFSQEAMLRGNPPHCMPMWRKSLHEKNGFFEEKYRSASDWEFWLRCTFNGSKMNKLNKPLGLYFFNPKGMSTNKENDSWKRKEEREVFKKYNELNKQKVAVANA